MIEGRCWCGGVGCQYDGEIEAISICRCSPCRKAQGTPFACDNAFPIHNDSKASWRDRGDMLPRHAGRKP